MRTLVIINQEKFEKFLNWLDPNSESAAQKYELMLQRLIDFFESRGCLKPDDLADETITRVLGKIDELVDTYQGKPNAYFFYVAKRVFYEYSNNRCLKN